MVKICAPLNLLCLLLLMSCKPGSSPSENTRLYQLQVTADPAEAGTVTPKLENVDEGDEVQITAAPNSKWVFDSWQGDHTGNTNQIKKHNPPKVPSPHGGFCINVTLSVVAELALFH